MPDDPSTNGQMPRPMAITSPDNGPVLSTFTPMQFKWGTDPADRVAPVRLVCFTATGAFAMHMPPDTAIEIANGLIEQAKAAKAGIQIVREFRPGDEGKP